MARTMKTIASSWSPQDEAPDAPLNRSELAQKAVREALLDVVWSNIEIPHAMKGVVARNSAATSYSKALNAEKVLIGEDLRPHWPADASPATEFKHLDAGLGWRPDFSQDAELEFLRMHTLRQYGHYVYSDDDMPKMAAQAKAAGADEAIFGLLETIRVERRMGISLGRTFDWEGYYPEAEAEALPPAQRPLFQWLRDGFMHAEGDADMRSTLNNFYDRLVGALDSQEVIDLAREWKEEIFPKLAPPPQPGDGEGEEGQPSQGSPEGKGKPGEGKGQPGKGEGSGDGQGGEGQAADGSEPNEPSSESEDQKPYDGSPGSQAKPKADPYGASKPQGPGKSSMVEQIMAGQARDAKAEAKAAEAASKAVAAKAPSEAESGKGKDGKKGEGKEEGKALTEIGAPTNEEAKSERAGHGYSAGAGAGDGKEPAPGEWRTMPANVELLEGSTDLFRHMGGRGRSTIDQAEVAKAKRVLERMLTGQTRNTLSDTPSKRMSIRHLARGEIKYARRDDFSRGAMHIDIVVDCSGSMNGAPINSARSLLCALSELSAKGLVHGRAIFSSGQGWMACPLPMKPEKIQMIQAFSGSEGIQRALQDNVRKLRESDAVFVYTDAQITDCSFSKSDLKARKVEPLGLYVGADSAENGMKEYFDRYIIRPTLEDMCSAMVQRFLSQKKMVAATQLKKSKLRR